MRKFKKVLLPLALLLVTALIATGCSKAGSNDLMAEVKAAEWPESADTMSQEFNRSVSKFSWEIFENSIGEKGNVLVSPTSVYLALSMTLNGAQEDTLEGMKDALKLENMTIQDFNESCRNWILRLRQHTDRTKLFVANSIWFREGYGISEDFLQNNADYFDAGARSLDFNDTDSVKVINDWVKEHTMETIDSIVDEIHRDTIMYLINAVYFKSDWDEKFLSDDTIEQNFNSPEGIVVVDFLNRTGEISYLARESFEGVVLPYENNRYGYFAFMPNNQTDLRDFVRGMDSMDLSQMIDSVEKKAVRLSMPKFEMAYENSLVDELSIMGMETAFSGNADFSNMNASGISELFINDVRHKTFCKVNEEGTEAAAVTSVEMRLTSAPSEEIQITFDRPFLFGIWDNNTDTPLFIGLMENPK
ncbi:serpin family protein [Alkalibacter mobilis]|uniref:serpin family protein n=1 Tax=Alkalibacter mobilis TaxID=2787712 RepID=UPI00189F3FA5|nr:serpin family protein [Alkalibacter mobilis]MBF7097006.1 serpin family protein [Alkalibacter mobilis]